MTRRRVPGLLVAAVAVGILVTALVAAIATGPARWFLTFAALGGLVAVGAAAYGAGRRAGGIGHHAELEVERARAVRAERNAAAEIAAAVAEQYRLEQRLAAAGHTERDEDGHIRAQLLRNHNSDVWGPV